MVLRRRQLSVCFLAFIATALLVSISPSECFGAEEPVAVISAVSPAYPQLAKSANISTDFILKVSINAAGDVVSIEEVVAHPIFKDESLHAAREWKFAPTTSSNAIRIVQLAFSFKIMPYDSGPRELTSRFFPPYKVEVRAAQTVLDCPRTVQGKQK